MSDFQTAMLLAGFLVLVLTAVVVVRLRRPSDPPSSLTDRQSTDAIGADVAQLRADLVKHDGRLGEVEHHLAQVRTMLNALPSKDAVHRIALEVMDIRGDLKVNSAETLATARAVERIERILMEREK